MDGQRNLRRANTDKAAGTMPTGSVIRWLLTLFVAVTALAGAAPAAAAGRIGGGSADRAEIGFLQREIDQRDMAVAMGQICVQRAQQAQLTAFCQNLVSTQQQQITQLQAWLGSWYGITNYTAQRGADGQNQLNTLNGASANGFDIVFMNMLVQANTVALGRSQGVVANSRRADEGNDRQARGGMRSELVTFAANQAAILNADIAQLQGWLCQWYNQGCGRSQASGGQGHRQAGGGGR